MMQGDAVGGIIVLLAGAAVVMVCFVLWRFAQGRDVERNSPQIPQIMEMATIKEEITITSWGKVSALLLWLSVLWTLGLLAVAKNLIQQIEISLGLIGSLLLFVLGAALGRRRTYRVYRTDEKLSE